MLDPGQPVVGYLLKTFPKLSETFILNEILELERQGVALHIFSLRSPKDAFSHPAVAHVKSPVTYIPSVLPESNSASRAALLEAQTELSHWFRTFPRSPLDSAVQFYSGRPEAKDINELWQAIYLARELLRQNIAHLHVHFANVPTATAEIAQIICGTSYSITAHAKDIYLTEPNVLDRRMAQAEFVLTCTDFNRRYLQRISRSDTSIHLAYHGIDVQTFTPSLPTSTLRQAGSQPVRLLSVGRFCKKKGFEYLLKACRSLQSRSLSFTCTLVGYGPLQPQIEQWIDDNQLGDRVTLAGKLPQDQVIDHYRQADVFVLPCVVTQAGDRDGIPNVLLEAMAMRLPVVSTQISGIGELVQSGYNGLLVPQRDVEALTGALERLIANAEWRSHLGCNAQHTVRQRFMLQHNIGDVKNLLLKSLTRQTGPSVCYRSLPTSDLPTVDQLEAALS